VQNRNGQLYGKNNDDNDTCTRSYRRGRGRGWSATLKENRKHSYEIFMDEPLSRGILMKGPVSYIYATVFNGDINVHGTGILLKYLLTWLLSVVYFSLHLLMNKIFTEFTG
jgi:hypothetical protein